MEKSSRLFSMLPFALVVLAAVTGSTEARPFTPEKCRSGSLADLNLPVGTDLVVAGPCTVGAGTYRLGNVNIIAGGALTFDDATIDLWVKSILIENDGSLIAGTAQAPIGTNPGAVVTIHLYGEDQGVPGSGVTCLTDAMCGIPAAIWNSNIDPNTHRAVPRAQAVKISAVLAANPGLTYPGVTDDYFYAYHPLTYDDANPLGYFGYKVLAVSYGGSLSLFGKKGACDTTRFNCSLASTSGTSWVRLAVTAAAGTSSLTVDRAVTLSKGDQIVVTTTDYLPSHSEQLTVAADVAAITVIPVVETLKYDHNGQRYPLSVIPARLGIDPDLTTNGAETRAAVGILSRSIRIVSEGAGPTDPFPSEPGQFFGGHTIVRQGVKTFQVQGVEFFQLGQGGRIGHYPVHFHHARKMPPQTFVVDSAVHDSMTRWYVIHGTQNVLLARNVGYKSIGHGYYLEEGTEINNQLFSNLGILVRGGVDDGQNDRKVPGILAAPDLATTANENVPYRSDYDHPTVFWIMNGWNDFQYNVAVGATACGVCYWLLPAYNSGLSVDHKWQSYASLQSDISRAGSTPLKSFVGNSCAAAMMSFNTVGDTAVCQGVGNSGGGFPFLDPIRNILAPKSPFAPGSDPNVAAAYYPNVVTGGFRVATRCDVEDCSATGPEAPKICSSDNAPGHAGELNCMVTMLDRYTSSFNWPDFNYSAIWLRSQWYLVSNSVLTDVQGAGLTFVTGGGYSASDRVTGHWALAQKSVFIGTTQPGNKYALDGGPFNPLSKLYCAAMGVNGVAVVPGNYCLSAADGVSFPVSNFGMSQRLFSVYDGPSFQDSNAYLAIHRRIIDDCTPFVDQANIVGRCAANWTDDQGLTRTNSAWIAGSVQGLLKGKDPTGKEVCYMPNAAIGWKQPNGFYYPPAFHSENLFFDNVDIRHFVIEPLFKPGTFETNVDGTLTNPVTQNYCVYNRDLFTGFTDVDRQTVLNDDDGSLTGYRDTISVNLDEFFTAPVEGIECASNETAKASPYEYVTTVVYPRCATTGACAVPPPDDPTQPNPHIGDWDRPCSNQFCFGPPLYRQLLTAEDAGEAQRIRMMGQSIGQRSTLTVTNGVYYLDTTVSKADQESSVCVPGIQCSISVFQPNQTYYVFLLYAKDTTKQTYQIYVGKTATFDVTTNVFMSRADIRPIPVVFTNEGWPTSGWTREYDPATGILTVSIDLAGLGAVTDADLQRNCQPDTFCSWNEAGRKCEDVNPTNPAVADSVCRWAVIDLDCPVAGCFGFGVTLPPEFTTRQANNYPDPRPAATCFPQRDPSWNVSFASLAAPQDIAGTCFNAPILPSNFCTPPALRRPRVH